MSSCYYLYNLRRFLLVSVLECTQFPIGLLYVSFVSFTLQLTLKQFFQFLYFLTQKRLLESYLLFIVYVHRLRLVNSYGLHFFDTIF